MNKHLTRLFPPPGEECLLEGLYLQHQLQLRGQPGKPFVYSNFITSLDGRIAIGTPGQATHTVPAATTNARDWRLFQELAGQADCLITSGRFFRQSAMGEAQDQLPVGAEPAFADIRDWRLAHGLAEQPDIAIVSGSLDIPPASLTPYRQRNLLVVTGEAADPVRVDALLHEGIDVIRAGNGTRVDARLMIPQLASRGYRSIYAIAGPAVFHTLLAGQVIDRLYLTITQQLLGGDVFDTLTRGALLSPAQGMQMTDLYHDPHAPANAGQLFGVFEPQT